MKTFRFMRYYDDKDLSIKLDQKMIYFPIEVIEHIFIISDGLSREQCSVVCKLFYNANENIKINNIY